MNQINRLRDTLKPHLGWHGARLSFLALFLISLLRVKTVNLVELATGFRNSAKNESNYKGLQRFFRDFDVDYAVIAKMIVTIMNIPQPWVLSIDRTEWRSGQTWLNILMLGVVHNGVAYPLVWQILDILVIPTRMNEWIYLIDLNNYSQMCKLTTSVLTENSWGQNG